jgi:hypothetical protein
MDDEDKFEYFNLKKEMKLDQENIVGDLSLKDCIALSENTMPGLFISTMYERAQPLCENELYDCVFPRLSYLRKSYGSKYKLVSEKI